MDDSTVPDPMRGAARQQAVLVVASRQAESRFATLYELLPRAWAELQGGSPQQQKSCSKTTIAFVCVNIISVQNEAAPAGSDLTAARRQGERSWLPLHSGA